MITTNIDNKIQFVVSYGNNMQETNYPKEVTIFQFILTETILQ